MDLSEKMAKIWKEKKWPKFGKKWSESGKKDQNLEKKWPNFDGHWTGRVSQVLEEKIRNLTR